MIRMNDPTKRCSDFAAPRHLHAHRGRPPSSLCLFVSSSLRLSFSRYSQAFFVGIFTVLQLISVFFSYIVIYNRIKAALLLSNRTHEAALWAVFRSPMRWVDG